MRQGTTPTHEFGIPFDVSKIERVMVIYAQNNAEILRKDTEQCEMDGTNIKVRLDQDDTFMFDHKKPVQIQLRILLDDGTALASQIKTVSVEQCLNDEVL